MIVGDSTGITRTFSTGDLRDYTELSGHEVADDHIPGPMIGALFSYLLGVKLPGMGTNYLKQETSYKAEARTGEPLSARVEITRIRTDKQLVDLATTCKRADGQTVASGRALVYVGELMSQGRDEN